MSQIQTQIPLKYVIIVIGIVLLSALDALFTIVHIGQGAKEIMPFMRWALSQGNIWFIGIKMTITAFGGMALCMWYRVRLARMGLVGLLVGYGMVFGYHIMLAMFWSL